MDSRAELYAILDAYLAALTARDPALAPLADDVFNTENNVRIAVGDGLWNTITARHPYDLRLAEAGRGQVALFTAVKETDALNPCCIRLEVSGGRITGIETVVARNKDEGFPFGPQHFERRATMEAVLPASARASRDDLIRIADGYFDTMERNDGTIRTRFWPHCARVENGVQTTSNPAFPLPVAQLGCEEQFALGWYRYDDQLRARRFPLVDIERGIVLACGFIDHSGKLGEYRLTDGTIVTSPVRRPHSYYLAEAFRIREGAIEAVEADFLTVPYRMASPWDERERLA